MNDLKNYNLDPASLLTKATNVLYKAMQEVPRTTSKNIFKVIAGGNVPVFDAQSDNSLMIGIPAVTQEGDATNVLMLIIDLRLTGGILLKLKYFDHSPLEPAEQTVH